MMIHLLPPLLSKEAQLIVLCARTAPDAGAVGRIRQLAQGSVNWASVSEVAKWHGVVPLVYRNLTRFCAKLVLPVVLEDLKQYYQAEALLSHAMTKELGSLAQAFAARRIEVMPFKGLSVAATAYGDVTARDCGDIDLIVRQQDLPGAHETLLQAGYEYAIDAAPHGDDPAEPFHLFIKRQRAATVDLQWIMADRTFSFLLDRPEFWARGRTGTLGDTAVKVLSPEDHLIVLCAHGSKHVWEQLKWVCDVAELVRAYPHLNWTIVESSARAWGCWRLVLLGLALARALFGSTIPDATFRQMVADEEVTVCARRMPKNLLANPDHGIGEADCEALFFALKDSKWDGWWYGLGLCREQAPVLQQDYAWNASWKSLQRMNRVVQPLHAFAKRVVPSPRIRRRMARWLLPAQ